MKKVFLSLMAVLVATFMFSSCEKDSNTTTNSAEILKFDDAKAYEETMQKVCAMTLDELKQWEQSEGFTSFGRRADELYSRIDPESFTSQEEIVALVQQNSEHLQLIEGEDGDLTLETQLFDNPKRYLINADKMFQVGDRVYKVLSKTTVSTTANNAHRLRTVTEQNYRSVQNDAQLTIEEERSGGVINNLSNNKDLEFNYGVENAAKADDGRDRTHLWIYVSKTNTVNNLGVAKSICIPYILVKPYKRTLRVWFNCSRTISCDIKIAIDWQRNNDWERKIYSYSEKGRGTSELKKTFDSEENSDWGAWTFWDVHFAGYDCWADTPSTPPAILQENISLF